MNGVETGEMGQFRQGEVSTSSKGEIVSLMNLPLLEEGCETFIRYNEAISIVKKVQVIKEPTLLGQVSSMKPSGLRTFHKLSSKPKEGQVLLYQNGEIGCIDSDETEKNQKLIGRYKVFIPRAGSRSDSFPHQILGKPFTAKPLSAFTETYLVLGDYDNQIECNNLCS